MKSLAIILLLLIFSACSIFQTSEKEETTKNEDEQVEEVYVFDDISDTEDKSEEIKNLEEELDKTITPVSKEQTEESDVFDETKINETESNTLDGTSFFIQLGAYSTIQRAEIFVQENKSKLPFQLSIIFNSDNSLYTVRSASYKTKTEAERVRNELWSKDSFKDSFIVTE